MDAGDSKSVPIQCRLATQSHENPLTPHEIHRRPTGLQAGFCLGIDPGRAAELVEAVVQSMPEWVDPQEVPETGISELTPVNGRFGRRFEIASYRDLSPAEVAGNSL